jgi:hypothetical protein
MMLRFSNTQLQEIYDAAQVVPYKLREEFLTALAAELRDVPAPGDGDVHRAAHAAARAVLQRHRACCDD